MLERGDAVQVRDNCSCKSKKYCFHQECKVLRKFQSTGRYLIENHQGYVMGADLPELKLLTVEVDSAA